MPSLLPQTRSLIDQLDPDLPVLIAGATASGKSALALQIAERQGGQIINADALQVYECWSLLSARPDASELARAPHALYGYVPFETPYSVGEWLRAVTPVLSSGPRPIIVGGTGLYFSALTEGLSPIPPIPAPVRDQGNLLRAHDLAAMIAHLHTQDPETAAAIDLANPMRVQRAWEVLVATGTGLRAWHRKTPAPTLPLAQCQPIVVERPTDILADRIETRFHAMMQNGALDEVRALLPRWNPTLPAARAIGAQELIFHLKGEYSLIEATRLSIIATQQFAKRQRTWFRNRFKTWPRAPF